MSIKKYYIVFVTVLIAILASSCDDVAFTSDPDKKLRFSTDTLAFDTVFSSIGTTTERFLIYNRNSRAIRISNIRLAGGASSAFRLNVDGSRNDAGEFKNIEILAHDSMYVFVEATINPTSDNNPFLIQDSVLFDYNGNSQRVLLEAFGQNIKLLKNQHITSDSTLTDDKPFLIKGNLVVDSLATLTISAGCKLYFYNNANLVVYGNLNSDGTFDKPVEMRGSRTDEMRFQTPVLYHYVAGQWGGVYLMKSGSKHRFTNTNILSAYVGIYSPGDNRSVLSGVDVENCRIHNFVYYGIVAQNTNLKVVNSEISNTGSYCVYLSGGTHEFYQSTIANYYANNSFAPSSRDKSPAVMIMDLERIAPMKTIFTNCIVSGTVDNEFAIASEYFDLYDGTFSYSYLKRKNAYTGERFRNIKWYQISDKMFKQSTFDYKNNRYFDFTPDSLSPVRNMAEPAVASRYPVDLNGKNRFSDGQPDAGCYEFIPTVKR